MNYLAIQKEETLKARIFADHFETEYVEYTPNIGNIDFVVVSVFLSSITHCLWAEAKKGIRDIFDMLTQLILTCKKTYDSGECLPPPFIGCFDAVKIAFVPFHDILPIFADNDVNWNAAPSNYLSADFSKLREKVEKLTAKNITVFNFNSDPAELKNFIRKNIISGSGARESVKSPITKNNFPHIFYRWLKEVKPAINISADEWLDFKQSGVLDSDFFLADMMSKDGSSISEKLKIILANDTYKLHEHIKGRLFLSDIDFTDSGGAYTRFWNKYERPPAEEYQQYIIGRRDLLVPQNIREVKGSFYTPVIWVEKSQEYLEKVFGKDWQDEYYIWDCAAGTGNLLAGLTNRYNVWASDIDQPNIDTIRALIGGGLQLQHGHIFQFDFLNDNFTKLPEELKTIIGNPEKRRKLIVYINPPYAEGDSRKGRGRSGVAVSRIQKKYSNSMGYAKRQIFIQFLARIYFEIPGCKIGEFSTLTGLSGPRFIDFRNFFRAKLEACFIMPAYTFDNVKGTFPIGFKVWDTNKKAAFSKTIADVYNETGINIGKKTIYAYTGEKFINDWTLAFIDDTKESLGTIIGIANDFQHQNAVCIERPNKPWNHQYQWQINRDNILESCAYFAARLCIKPTWLNSNDQFLSPQANYQNDKEFMHNCLLYTLFHGKNRISCKYGANHWIPFTAEEVSANAKFESGFMSFFLKGKMFSDEARAVLSAGKALWKYYHKNSNAISVNASLYDIREFFQGRKDSGAMNVKSPDETYNALIKALRDALKILAKKIEPKIYEYGFLKK
ncbi:MAG: hypothetical protein LBG87_00525 [Spirochaetaceae bacterium]|jgi:hypothetical protein|nr:hypothetical protein [Spirochaetaceae bacterium]